MGVHGLWKLIEPSGQMIPLESLAGKVLAVDVSIWLHQAVKGMQDAHGAPLAVAHLLILFHRVCKLLFYKIKPVFVFDGGVPALKSQTMAARRQRSNVAKSEAMKVREKLIKNLLKHEALRHVLSDEAAAVALGLNSFTLPGPSVEEDLYKLPPVAVAADIVDSEYSDPPSSSDEETERRVEDIHSIDVTSQEFLSLPPEVRHDILTELIETRKQSSWKYLENMPKKPDNFSDFQMSRLLKRHAVQTSLEKAGKEMGGRALSLKELESLLGDQGVLDPNADLPSRRIAQDNVTRYMLVQKEPEKLPEEKEGVKFDIMDRLEDVEWSSESDTDIILQRSPKQKKVQSNSSSGTKQPVCNTQEKDESSSISKQPKVRITEEVADILSILEDKHATEDVKLRIENLQTKINFQRNSEDPKLIEQVPSEAEFDNIVTEDRQPVPDLPDESQTVTTPEPCLEVAKHAEEIKQEKTSCTDKMNTEPVPDIPPAVNSDEDSTDSEADFVPVSAEESQTGFDIAKERKSSESLPVAVKESDSLTLTINPSELSGKDDLFADIFEPAENGGNKKEVEVPEGETAPVGNSLDSEFMQQISAGDLSDLKRDLEQQHSEFLKEKGKQERLAVNLTDQVYIDAQELLRLFGIPFVVAPMEAEAQCATLNTIGLTEGTITDDSDIWLFGGKVVYKNFFNQQKRVLEYRSENIQKHFKLTREEMVKLALLVGSDYTVGLTGIGPVTALEIMAAFQAPKQGLLESLIKFRDWFTGTTPGGPPRATLRKKIRNTVLTPGFPSRAVVEAYLHPLVDDSREPFSWAKPNLDLIRKYVRAKLGWSAEKCNELLLPVLKKLEENTSQTTLDRHFKTIPKVTANEAILSKRVENAVKRLGSNCTESDEPEPDIKPRKKRKPNVRSSPQEKGSTEGPSKLKTSRSEELPTSSSNTAETSKLKLINERLHKNVKVPQREMAQKLLEEKKKEAIKIFRTYKGNGKRKTKVYAKEEIKLSESSSESD